MGKKKNEFYSIRAIFSPASDKSVFFSPTDSQDREPAISCVESTEKFRERGTWSVHDLPGARQRQRVPWRISAQCDICVAELRLSLGSLQCKNRGEH